MKTKSITEKNIKVCLVGSSGGHLTHLYMLKPFWKDKNTVRFMSLNDDPKEWAKEIIRLARKNVEKRSEASLEGKEKIRKSGYDILENAKFLEKAYLS